MDFDSGFLAVISVSFVGFHSSLFKCRLLPRQNPIPSPGLLFYKPMCMLSRFSHVQLFATLWTVARQVSLSMGFSRQEYWSGLPFPSPGALPNPGIEPASFVSPVLAGRFFTTSATWVEPRSPALQADSLPAEPQGKPKNTGVGSLSLLQRSFPTQELNSGLMHCRQILYHLSYQRSPLSAQPVLNFGGENYLKNLLTMQSFWHPPPEDSEGLGPGICVLKLAR